MAVVIPNGNLQATYKFTHTGVPKPWFVVMGHEDNVGATNDTNAATLSDLWNDNLKGRFEDSCLLVEVKTLVNRGGVMQVGLWTGSIAGTNGSFSQVPPNCALLTIKTTGLAGRHQRGRTYWGAGALSEAAVDDAGGVAAATVTAWNTSLEAWRLDMVGRDLEPRLLHDASAPSTTPTIITSMTTSTLAATQRRRMR